MSSAAHRVGERMRHSLNPRNPDGFQRFPVELLGGAWVVEIGYRIESLGQPARSWMTRDGMERDPGEAPTVTMVTAELIDGGNFLKVPMEFFNASMRSEMEAEIADRLQEEWK